MNVMDLFRGLEISNANFQRQTLYIFSHAKLKRKVLAVIPMWITSRLCNLYFSLGLNEKQLWHGIVSNAKNTESVQKDCYYTGFKEVWCTDVTDSGFQDLCSTLEHLSVHFWSPSVSPEPSTAASPFLHGVWTWTFGKITRTILHASISSSSWSGCLSADWRRCFPKPTFSKETVMKSELNWIYFQSTCSE